jgi:hypothetical protein
MSNQITRQDIVRLAIYSKDYSLDYEFEFGSFSTTQKKAIEIIKNEGAKIIFVNTDFREGDNPNTYLKRVNKIAKLAGYISTVELKDMHQEIDGVRKEWKEISGRLIK